MTITLARTPHTGSSWRHRLRELVARWRAYRASQVRYTTVMLPDGSYEHLKLRRWPSGRVDATVRKITYNGKRRPITDAHRLNAHLAAQAMWDDFYGDEVWGGSDD